MQVTTPDRPKKRRKVQEACVTCRRRKTRCDGVKPTCLACQERNVAAWCKYEPIHNNNNNNTTLPSSPAQPWLAGIPSATRRSDVVSDVVAEQDANGNGASILSVPSYTRRDELYGPASNVSFSHSVVPHLYAKSPASEQTNLKGSSGSHHDCSHLQAASQPVLPLRKNADDFVRCYFDLIWPMFPVLHRPSFMRRYEQLWSSGDTPEYRGSPTEEAVFLAIVNLVFALGSHCSQLIPLEQRTSIAEDFYDRSQKPCIVGSLDTPSLSTVQMLCLTAIYLQTTDATRCWYIAGLAIRVAQALGFHAEPGPAVQQTHTQIKVRRCIWHTCVTLDRLTAMGFGRPTMIQAGSTVPSPVAIEYPDKVATNDFLSDEYDELSLFAYSCKLFDILHDVLQQFYPCDRCRCSTHNDEELISETISIIRRMDILEHSIPSYLRVDQSKDAPDVERFSVLYLQQQILHCRFLFVRTLALRPLLLQSVRLEAVNSSNSTLTSSLDAVVVRQSYQDCIQTSCQLIEALYVNLDTPYRNSPWHTVYLVFSSGTILLAAWQSQSINTDQREPQFEHTWRKCMSILLHHARHLSSASRAIEVLNAMRANVLDETNKDKTSDQDIPQAPIQPTLDKILDGTVDGTEPTPSSNVEDISDFDFQISTFSDDWLDQFIADMNWLDAA